MPIVSIAPATREGMKLLISLFGLSETGKTLSALRLACGIEPDPAKRGLLDTEGGQRGRAYVDKIPGGYMYGELTAPYTPERYMEAVMDFVAAGCTTLVIDSGSHAWFSTGGILDMVEQATEKNDQAKWQKPKRRLGRMTQLWLHCGMHIIICSRGKQPLVEGPLGGNGKPTLVPGPILPVQEKSLRFDMTIMALMQHRGKFTLDANYGGKCPDDLLPIFAAGEMMDEEMGRKLISWIGGNDVKTGEQRASEIEAGRQAERGTVSFGAWWETLAMPTKRHLKANLENYRSVATAADLEASLQAESKAAAKAAATLDAPFGQNKEQDEDEAASKLPALRSPVQPADKAKVKMSPPPADAIRYPSDLEFSDIGTVLGDYDDPFLPGQNSSSFRSWLIALLVNAHTVEQLAEVRGREQVAGFLAAKKAHADAKAAITALITARAEEITPEDDAKAA